MVSPVYSLFKPAEIRTSFPFEDLRKRARAGESCPNSPIIAVVGRKYPHFALAPFFEAFFELFFALFFEAFFFGFSAFISISIARAFTRSASGT